MSKTIEISDEAATLLDVRSSAAGVNPSDLIATWAREDAARERSKKIAALQKLVDEGLASGPCDQSMDEILAEARAQVAAARRA